MNSILFTIRRAFAGTNRWEPSPKRNILFQWRSGFSGEQSLLKIQTANPGEKFPAGFRWGDPARFE